MTGQLSVSVIFCLAVFTPVVYSFVPQQHPSGSLTSRPRPLFFLGENHVGNVRVAAPRPCSASAEEEVVVLKDLDESVVAPQNFTVTFPSYYDLMDLSPGQYVASDPFSVMDSTATTHKFRLLMYPRGGGHATAKNLSVFSSNDSSQGIGGGGFGMSYKVLPFVSSKNNNNDRVGLYLQYLPHDEEKDSVDATFRLRLKGRQSRGPRFDVEWSSGMRFVSSAKQMLREGFANDFGAHMMRTELLPDFLGIRDTTQDGKLQVDVSMTVHSSSSSSSISSSETSSVVAKKMDNEKKESSLLSDIFPLKDIRTVEDDAKEHDGERVRVGKIVVPVLRRLSERPRMFQMGAYPGVEYRIMRIFDPKGRELFASVPGADYELRPLYPLVEQLERDWPVRVRESEIPRLYTAGMYNAISAFGSLTTALGGLTMAFIVSQAISLFIIPSRSMDPTLQVGDVLLVEKVTPRIFSQHKVGDVVLFSPPERLRRIVALTGGRITDRDLFVKRIGATAGDVVAVDRSGQVSINGEVPKGRRDLCGAEPLRLIERYIEPTDATLVDSRQVYVLGDCSSVSIDSRVWGPLSTNEIVGRPLFRVWPLDRFGSVPDLPVEYSETEWSED